MKTTRSLISSVRLSVLAALLLVGVPLHSSAQDSKEVIPDLTETPAMQLNNAESSVQLAVARAGDRLVSVGEQGIVLLSDDDGKSWNQAREVPVSVTLTDVEFVSDTEGWAVGHSGVVLRTETAGEQWNKVMNGQDILAIIQSAVQLLPDNEPDIPVLKRNAGYLTGDEPILDVHFSENGREGWLLGAYGIALRTRDAGQTWESAFTETANPNSYHLYQFVAAPGSKSFIVGERGLTSGSVPGSDDFEALPIDYQGTFFGGASTGNGQVIFFGLRGTVWGGDSAGWESIPSDSQASFSAGVATPRGIVLGDVTGRLFVKSPESEQFREMAQASDAAITDLILSSGGHLVMSTARGLMRLELDDRELK